MSTGRRRAGTAGRLRDRRHWRLLVLDVGATLGVLSVLAAVGFAALGVTPLVFRSGSMSPAIDAGSLALARQAPAADVHPGDVVSVISSTNVRITHRVVSTARTTDGTELTLKGDANPVPDAEGYQVSSVDRVFFSVPRLGYVADAMAGPLGFVLGGAVVAGVLLVLLAPARPGDSSPSPRGGSRKAGSANRRAGVAAVALVVIGAGAGAHHPVRGTLAEFKDDATAQSGTIGARTVAAPTTATCSASGTTSTIAIPNPDAMLDYEVTLETPGGTIVSTKQVTGTASSATFSTATDYGYGFGVSLGNTQTFVVRVRSYLAASTTWRSAGTTSPAQQVRVTAVQVVVPIVQSASCV